MPTIILEAAIDTILFRWNLMQTAVENELGGPDSLWIANRTASSILDLFKYSDGNFDGLIEILKRGLTDLNTVADANDRSLFKVAYTLTEIYEELVQGNYEAAKKLIDNEVVDDDEDEEDTCLNNNDKIVDDAVPVDKPNS